MIRNIIFDLCGPIIKIDVQLLENHLHTLGVTDPEPYRTLYRLGITKQFDCGLLTTDQFCQAVRQALRAKITDSKILEAWNDLVVGFDPRHIRTVRQLHAQGVRTFLLSNSDPVNAAFFVEYMNRAAGFDFVGSCFTQAYFSHALGLRKPQPEIFQFIIDRHGLCPGETLVIDDCLKHCQGAAQAGVHTHCLLPDEDICTLPAITELLANNCPSDTD